MENIIHFFEDNNEIEISQIFSNNAKCKAVKKAKDLNIPVEVFNKLELNNGEVLKKLKKIDPDLLVLAGFLLMIPRNVVTAFNNRIVNVHPALLPKYGGKGMYGDHVHKAVIENKESETGITIHYVNEHYDEGVIIGQFSVKLTQNETVDTIRKKVQALEKEYFPETIKKLLAQ